MVFSPTAYFQGRGLTFMPTQPTADLLSLSSVAFEQSGYNQSIDVVSLLIERLDASARKV